MEVDVQTNPMVAHPSGPDVTAAAVGVYLVMALLALALPLIQLRRLRHQH
jgi:hypothetical protein